MAPKTDSFIPLCRYFPWRCVPLITTKAKSLCNLLWVQMFWDFTCVSTMAESYLRQTIISPTEAADHAEQRKKTKYNLLGNNYHFMPITIETFGTWGSEGSGFSAELCSLLNNVTHEPCGSTFLRQRLSIALQRGNASSVLGTVEKQTGFEELYFVLNV